ncbi:hypothetical protein Tco_0993452 [Tanacetum coccineum]
MLLYSWDGELDVCMDMTGSSTLKQTRMVDLAPGRAVIDAAQRKRDKYMAKCAPIAHAQSLKRPYGSTVDQKDEK